MIRFIKNRISLEIVEKEKVMKESQIQLILEKLIQEEILFSRIKNVDSVQKLYESFHDKDSYPSFSIDYFSRKKLICAAKHVVSSLKSVQVISTASKNISIDRKDKLFPDLLLLNQEKGKIIILEIKRSVKTVRETLTEMLAYDHEVRNCLPFLSNFEILFCIVSTEYSTLLNHSITGLVTWESKQILCLSVKESEEDLEIEIYIPPAWTSLGIRDLPSTAISTLKIILYKRSEDGFSPDAESAVLYASSLIAKDGDRNNSHGFALVWRDCLSLEYLSEYHLTIGFINPYSLLPFAHNLGTIDVSQNPLGQYFLENADNFSSYDCPEVFERGIKFLEKFFCVDIEGLSNWSNDRSKPHEVLNPTSLMYYRAFPLKVELWGALGDFSRDLIVHPGVEKSLFSKFCGKILGCEDPFIAIPLIDNISGARKVDERGFTCRTLFDLGVTLGSLLTLYSTATRYEKNDLGNLPALITWFMLDIQPVLLELGMQYSSSSRLDTPPPPVKFRSHSNFEEALESIECLLNWIYTEFLDETEDIHSECFTVGLIIHPLMDQYFSSGLTESQKASFEERVIASSISLLNWLASQCLLDYRSLKYTQHIFYILSNTYFNCEVKNITRESLPFQQF